MNHPHPQQKPPPETATSKPTETKKQGFFSSIWDKKTTEPKKELNGIFFGQTSDKKHKNIPIGKSIYEDGHVLVIGGAGSGKSSCIAIPTLKYFWDGRFLAVDIKGELAKKSGRKAHIFNPIDSTAQGFDPFYLIPKSEDPTPWIKDIALAIVPTIPDSRDPFWVQASQDILTGHLLFNYKNGASFIEAINFLQSVPTEVLMEIDSEDTECQKYFIRYKDTRKETLASIMSQLSSHVIPFATDSQLQAALTSKNSITPELLEQGRDIFLQIPEYKIAQWGGLISLILRQFLNHFERRPESKDTPILFLLDEFARFGKLEGIVHGLATLRSKKITICILIQSLAQLDATYGQEQRKIIADNCSYKAVLSATDADTQKYFSALMGTEEVEHISYTQGSSSRSTTTSTKEQARIKPEEFGNLGDRLVLIAPQFSGYVQKVGYWQL